MKISYDFNERKSPYLTWIFLRIYAVVMLRGKTSIKNALICGKSYIKATWSSLHEKKVYYQRKLLYNHSGDDSIEDPPVPIPNTEVKLYYVEST